MIFPGELYCGTVFVEFENIITTCLCWFGKVDSTCFPVVVVFLLSIE